MGNIDTYRYFIVSILPITKLQTDNQIPDFFTIFQRWVHFTCILMAFVTTHHLQASADAALSCKPGRLVTRDGHDYSQKKLQLKVVQN